MSCNAQSFLSFGFLALILIIIVHSYRQKAVLIEKNNNHDDILGAILNQTDKLHEKFRKIQDESKENDKVWRQRF